MSELRLHGPPELAPDADPDYRPEPWVAEVRVWAPGGIEVAYGAESFEGWEAGPEAVDAAVEKAIELLYRAGESAKLGLGMGRPL